jgi:hypothetical protein
MIKDPIDVLIYLQHLDTALAPRTIEQPRGKGNPRKDNFYLFIHSLIYLGAPATWGLSRIRN